MSDKSGDLLMVSKHVLVYAFRDTGLIHQALHQQGGFWTRFSMLKNQGIPQNQIGRCKACYLVERIVPRHDTQERANWTALNYGNDFVVFVDLLICGQLFPVVSIVAKDVGTESYLFVRFCEGLADFFGYDCCYSFGLILKEPREVLNFFGTLRDRQII